MVRAILKNDRKWKVEYINRRITILDAHIYIATGIKVQFDKTW